MASTSDDRPLFEPDSGSDAEEPTAKRARFFASTEQGTKEDSVMVMGDEDDGSDDGMMFVEEQLSAAASVAGPSAARRAPTASISTWTTHYFDSIVASGYMLYKNSSMCSLKEYEAVTLSRITPAVGTSKTKTKEDSIVRFKNSKGIEVGRLAEADASWIAKLMDLKMATFEGTVLQCAKEFRSGDSVVLSLTVLISRSAFDYVPPILSSSKSAKAEEKGLVGDTSLDSFKETGLEKLLTERKLILTRLFQAINLRPLPSSAKPVLASRSTVDKGKGKSKARKVDIVIDGDAEDGGEDGDGEKMDDNQLNLVYSRAIKNDARLPEMDPPSSFSLELRPYQKQALCWMSSMEGRNDVREELSMHPLWSEYVSRLARSSAELHSQ